MGDLEKRILAKRKKSSPKEISERVNVSESYVKEVLNGYKSRIRKYFLLGTAAAASLFLASAPIFLHKDNESLSPQDIVALTSDPSFSAEFARLGDELQRSPMLNPELFAKTLTGLNVGIEEFQNVMEDKTLSSLQQLLADTQKNPTVDGIENLRKAYKSNEDLVKTSRYTTENYRVLLMAERNDRVYLQERANFLEYMDRNWRKIYAKLQSEEKEFGGFIQKTANGFTIEFRGPQRYERNRQYVLDVLIGKSEIYDEAIKELENEKYLENELSSLLRKYIYSEKMLKLLQNHPERKLSEKFLNQIRLINSDAKETLETYTYGYLPHEYMGEMVANPNVIADWHSHLYFPNRQPGASEQDKKESFLIGSMVVLQLMPNGLEVHEVIRGNETALRKYSSNPSK